MGEMLGELALKLLYRGVLRKHYTGRQNGLSCKQRWPQGIEGL